MNVFMSQRGDYSIGNVKGQFFVRKTSARAYALAANLKMLGMRRAVAFANPRALSIIES